MSLSWSALLMQKKLAKAIKNSKANNATPRTILDKIDRQYSFNCLVNNKGNQIDNLKGLEDVSNINFP